MHLSPPFVYLLVDLRPWLVALALASIAARLLRPVLGAPIGRWWAQGETSTWTRLLVGAIAVSAVVVSTPHLRFDTSLHGDEPKYLRYCLAFYQGLGFDLDRIRPGSEIPIGEPPHLLRTLRLFADAVPREARALARDARTFLRAGLSERFNRAQYLGNWFIRGKRGGLYQVHNPGLSFVLLPGFIVDQWFFRIHPGWSDQFPDDLFCTNLLLLLIYGAWTIVLFQVLTRLTGRQGLAAALALVAMFAVPVGDMAFQIYPETLAGLALLVVVRHLLHAEAPTLPGAAAVGLLLGALPWLHIRFLAVSLLAAAFAPLLYRRRAAALSLAVGCSISLLLLSFYAYHVTGSILPTSMYYTDQAPEPLEPHLIVPGLLGTLFDRDYGWLPYSPIYGLAFAGLIPWWKRDRTAAAFAMTIAAALAVPSAGHSWNSAGGSPLRHLTAVAPLAMFPLVETIRAAGRSRLFRIVAGLLALFSLHNAWTYNQHHLKHMGPMIDASASGWKTLLLFPRVFAVEEATRKTFEPTILLGIWIAIVVALVCAPLVGRRFWQWSETKMRGWPAELTLAAGLVAVAAVGTLVGALTGVGLDPNYALR